MTFCCGLPVKWEIRKTIHNHPYFRRINFAVCPHCGTPHFLDFRQYEPGKETAKSYTGKAALKQVNYWETKLKNQKQGTFSKQFFNYGTFKRAKNGYFKTYRTNFNNEKEFLFKEKIKITVV